MRNVEPRYPNKRSEMKISHYFVVDEEQQPHGVTHAQNQHYKPFSQFRGFKCTSIIRSASIRRFVGFCISLP